MTVEYLGASSLARDSLPPVDHRSQSPRSLQQYAFLAPVVVATLRLDGSR